MSSVEIKRGLEGKIARMAGVKGAVNAEARQISARANAIIAPHRKHFPGVEITVERHKMDSHVVMEQPRGDALAIEFGRGAYRTKSGKRVGAMAPIAPLRGAIQ